MPHTAAHAHRRTAHRRAAHRSAAAGQRPGRDRAGAGHRAQHGRRADPRQRHGRPLRRRRPGAHRGPADLRRGRAARAGDAARGPRPHPVRLASAGASATRSTTRPSGSNACATVTPDGLHEEIRVSSAAVQPVRAWLAVDLRCDLTPLDWVPDRCAPGPDSRPRSAPRLRWQSTDFVVEADGGTQRVTADGGPPGRRRRCRGRSRPPTGCAGWSRWRRASRPC